MNSQTSSEHVTAKALSLDLHIVKPGGKEADGDLAWEIVYKCFRKGLLMFAPVGFGRTRRLKLLRRYA